MHDCMFRPNVYPLQMCVAGQPKKQSIEPTNTRLSIRERRRSVTPAQGPSELEPDTDFLGTAGRREVELAHKQEETGATTQWGFLCIPTSPPADLDTSV